MAAEKVLHTVPEESHSREFLASERTFLAWIRTSVAVIGFGFAAIKFDTWIERVSPSASARPSQHLPLPIGELMIMVEAILAALGAWHYRRTNRQITEGVVEPSFLLIFTVAGIIILLSIAVLLYLMLQGAF